MLLKELSRRTRHTDGWQGRQADLTAVSGKISQQTDDF